MKFEFVERNRKISDAELISDIVSVAKRLNNSSLSMEEYQENGQFDSSTVSRHFGSWNKALSIAGLMPRNSFHTEQELLDNMYNVWVTKGKQPVRNDMNNHNISCVSSGAYIRKYGSWSNALKTFVEYINCSDTNVDDVQKEKVIKSFRTPRDINLRLRFKVMQRDGFKCCICGAAPANDPSVTLHVDHILPYSKGGETIIDNLQTLCSKCNLGKGNL